MTTYASTITAAKTAQAIDPGSINAASATNLLNFANSSTTDVLIVSVDGQPASPTHGFIANPGGTIDLLAIVQQLMNIGVGPGLSVWGPSAGAGFSIAVG